MAVRKVEVEFKVKGDELYTQNLTKIICDSFEDEFGITIDRMKELAKDDMDGEVPVTDEPVEFYKVNQCNGVSEMFMCSYCKSIIHVGEYKRSLEYNFCPYCGNRAE